jgi:hypothetical protein
VVSLAKFEGVVQNFRLLPRSLVKPVAWSLVPSELGGCPWARGHRQPALRGVGCCTAADLYRRGRHQSKAWSAYYRLRLFRFGAPSDAESL